MVSTDGGGIRSAMSEKDNRIVEDVIQQISRHGLTVAGEVIQKGGQ